jgi:hypothetical protein
MCSEMTPAALARWLTFCALMVACNAPIDTLLTVFPYRGE